jgi:hypothetical protein
MPDSTKVPPVDEPTSGQSDNARELSTIELAILDADAKAKQKLNREADQRYWLRWAAVCISVLIIIGMAFLLKHSAHEMVNLAIHKAPAIFFVAAYVAPILSMTTLSIALLVAAFRGFKDGDEKSGFSMATESARATGLIQ